MGVLERERERELKLRERELLTSGNQKQVTLQ